MALVNHFTKEVQFKIVYCGTPLGGKTSNLIYVHSRLRSDLRGDLVSLATASNRTLFFDFLQVEATTIASYQTRFQLYTVPGQEVYDHTREIVLKGADGIVFVADSEAYRLEENVQALQTVREVLERLNRDPDTLPWVFQFNKRDLPDAIPVTTLAETLETGERYCFEAVATEGLNVFATLEALTQEILRQFHYTQVGETEAGPESHRTSPETVEAT